MKYPKYLPKGGRIGYIAPSFGCSFSPYKEKFENALRTFSELGFQNVKGPNWCKSDGIGKSTNAKDCAAEINDFFLNDKCDVIISCGGGETMCEDLLYVDFERIKESEGKWYMGYSDNTNLTFLLPLLCDIAAVYGPGAATFGMREWHPSLQDAMDVLMGQKLNFKNYDGWEAESLVTEENPLEPFNISMPYRQMIVGSEPAQESASNSVTVGSELRQVSFTGRMMGGCLDCLVNLCGTRFDKVREFNERYKEDGVIWFLETCDLNPFSTRRALWQLKEAGWFDNARGFLIGRPARMTDNFYGVTCENAVLSMLQDFELPIVMNVDIGHVSPRIPIISGGLAKVEAVENSLCISYSEATE